MKCFIDCQSSLVPWGVRAKFRQAKVGLIRKNDSTVYIAIFFANEQYKLTIDPKFLEILPAAMRFKDSRRDLFIRRVNDKKRYNIMMRAIQAILNQETLQKAGKGETLAKLISTIPLRSSLKDNDVVPARVGLRIMGGHNSMADMDYDEPAATSDEIDFDLENDPLNFKRYDSKTTERNSLTKEHLRRLANRQLRYINLARLEGQLPDVLWFRNSLQELTLIDCNLTHVPKQIATFSSSLVSLNLSRNRIDELPRNFCCKMKTLQSLDISYNLIETLPIEIKFLDRVVDLNISHNHLRMLPTTFSDLKRLKCLNVANNNLSQLPAFRVQDIRLKQLDVSHNPLDGALNEASTFEVFPSYDEGPPGYEENLFCRSSSPKPKKFPKLFEIAMLNIVRCDTLLKLASEESLPRTIVSTMQRDIFKCYKCNRMNILPAYNSTDILDYVDQVDILKSTGNYRHGMTFMKLLCRSCFDQMSS